MTDYINLIADYYGYDTQSRQLVEEMAELTKAINKLWRHESGQVAYKYESVDLLNNVYEELADVEVMLEQIKHLLNCHTEVDTYKEYKVKRTLERMEKEHE